MSGTFPELLPSKIFNANAMQIRDLSECPHAIDQLAGWHYQQWASLYPDHSQQTFADELRQSLEGLKVPRTWVICDGDRVFGSASVIHDDMSTHPELTPWLASVYIDASLRGKGWGSRLIQKVMQDCTKAGFEKLYLFTPGQEDFYRALGWSLRNRETYQGEAVSIMTFQFSASEKDAKTPASKTTAKVNRQQPALMSD